MDETRRRNYYVYKNEEEKKNEIEGNYMQTRHRKQRQRYLVLTQFLLCSHLLPFGVCWLCTTYERVCAGVCAYCPYASERTKEKKKSKSCVVNTRCAYRWSRNTMTPLDGYLFTLVRFVRSVSYTPYMCISLSAEVSGADTSIYSICVSV